MPPVAELAAAGVEPAHEVAIKPRGDPVRQLSAALADLGAAQPPYGDEPRRVEVHIGRVVLSAPEPARAEPPPALPSFTPSPLARRYLDRCLY
jgi:hypothetical protein